MNLNCNSTQYRNTKNKWHCGLRSLGLLTKPTFLTRLFKAGYLFDMGRITEARTELFKTQVTSMINTLQRVYPGAWDVMLDNISTNRTPGVDNKAQFTLVFIIHHKKVVITNSKNEEHTIKDLLTTFTLRSNDSANLFYFYALYGTKATFSEAECYKGYVHSHLQRSNTKGERTEQIFAPSEYCLGDGEITDIMSMLRSNYSEGMFELFLLTFDTVARWESLEGVPYNYIQNVRMPAPRSSEDSPRCSFSISRTRTLFNMIKDQTSILAKVDYTIQGNEVKIDFSENVINEIKKFIVDNETMEQCRFRYFTSGLHPAHEGRSDLREQDLCYLAAKPLVENAPGAFNPPIPDKFTYIQGHKLPFHIELPSRENIIIPTAEEEKEHLLGHDLQPRVITDFKKHINDNIRKREDRSYLLRGRDTGYNA